MNDQQKRERAERIMEQALEWFAAFIIGKAAIRSSASNVRRHLGDTIAQRRLIPLT